MDFVVLNSLTSSDALNSGIENNSETFQKNGTVLLAYIEGELKLITLSGNGNVGTAVGSGGGGGSISFSGSVTSDCIVTATNSSTVVSNSGFSISGNSLTLEDKGIVITGSSPRDINLQGASNLNLDSGDITINFGGNISINSGNISTTSGDIISTSGNLTVGGTCTFGTNFTIDNAGNVTLLNNSNLELTGGNITVTGGSSIISGLEITKGSSTITVNGLDSNNQNGVQILKIENQELVSIGSDNAAEDEICIRGSTKIVFSKILKIDSGTPNITPEFLGQIYYDSTQTGGIKFYIATQKTGIPASDWEPIS